MKSFLIIFVLSCLLFACSSQKASVSDPESSQKVNVETTDSTEYELVVFDARFESFLVSQPYPKNYYSNDYYANWNYRYCVEWNIRHSDPLRYGDFYETNIPYDQTVDYGLDFNFTLYQYFQFIDKEYGIVLIRRRGR